MGNTNQELSNRIDKLQKEVEKFSKNIEPISGYYEGQLWYDRINKTMKVWNGEEYVTI